MNNKVKYIDVKSRTFYFFNDKNQNKNQYKEI